MFCAGGQKPHAAKAPPRRVHCFSLPTYIAADIGRVHISRASVGDGGHQTRPGWKSASGQNGPTGNPRKTTMPRSPAEGRTHDRSRENDRVPRPAGGSAGAVAEVHRNKRERSSRVEGEAGPVECDGREPPPRALPTKERTPPPDSAAAPARAANFRGVARRAPVRFRGGGWKGKEGRWRSHLDEPARGRGPGAAKNRTGGPGSPGHPVAPGPRTPPRPFGLPGRAKR